MTNLYPKEEKGRVSDIAFSSDNPAYNEVYRRHPNQRRDAQYNRIYIRDGGLCWLCRRPVRYSAGTKDHLLVKSLGGPGTIDNLRLAHAKCNEERADSMDENFLTEEWPNHLPLPREVMPIPLTDEEDNIVRPSFTERYGWMGDIIPGVPDDQIHSEEVSEDDRAV